MIALKQKANLEAIKKEAAAKRKIYNEANREKIAEQGKIYKANQKIALKERLAQAYINNKAINDNTRWSYSTIVE